MRALGLLPLALCGCLGTGPAKSGDGGPDEPDAAVPPDCTNVPPYPDPTPDAPYGGAEGDTLRPFSIYGAAPDRGIEPGIFGTNHPWCWANLPESPSTVMLIEVGTTTGDHDSHPEELQAWHEAYEARGLIAWGIVIRLEYRIAEEYWNSHGSTHPWAGDPIGSVIWLVDPDGDGDAPTPSVLIVDMTTMRIVDWHYEFRGDEDTVFGPYLRP